MTLRKGQAFFNALATKHKLSNHKCESTGDLFPYYNLHQVLFYMTDKEFDEVMTLVTDGISKESA